jgi:hypothetical protein
MSIGTTNYLQSASEIQTIADWLFATYGSLERRSTDLKIDAARYPAAWVLVAGLNVGDCLQIVDQPMSGGPVSTGTYRVSLIARRIAFGANGSTPEASVTITCDPLVTFFE